MGLPLAARRARVELLHAPAYTAPVGIRTPVVVTIHDVSYERHPSGTPIAVTGCAARSTAPARDRPRGW